MQLTAVRAGGALAVGGGLLSAGLLLARPTFGGDLQAQLTSIAQTDYLTALDLAALASNVLAMLGALAIVATFRGHDRVEWLAAAARPLVLIGTTVSLASIAVGMFAYRLIARNFVQSTEANRQSVLDSAFSMNATLYALDALSGLLAYGLVPLVLGAAILISGLYPRWLGGVAVSAGLLEIIICTVALIPGATMDLASLDYLASVLIMVTFVGAGLFMLLRPARLSLAESGVQA